MCIGCIGEVAAGLGSEFAEFAQKSLSIGVEALNDEEEEVQSNAAFTVGVIIEKSGFPDIER